MRSVADSFSSRSRTEGPSPLGQTLTASPQSVLVLSSMYRSCASPSASVSLLLMDLGIHRQTASGRTDGFCWSSVQEVEVPLPSFGGLYRCTRCSADCPAGPRGPLPVKTAPLLEFWQRKSQWDRHNWDLSPNCKSRAKGFASQIAVQEWIYLRCVSTPTTPPNLRSVAIAYLSCDMFA